MVLVDELGGLVAQLVRQITDGRHFLATAEDGVRRIVVAGGVEIRMRTAQESEILVKTSRHGLHLRPETEVPLAEHAGRVTGLLEVLGDGLFPQRQADGVREAGIQLDAESHAVSAGHRPARVGLHTGHET